jgi:hypothetical protein
LRAPSEEKSDSSKDSFYAELEQVFDQFPEYYMKFCLEILMKKRGERIFSNRQSGMRIYIRIVKVTIA